MSRPSSLPFGVAMTFSSLERSTCGLCNSEDIFGTKNNAFGLPLLTFVALLSMEVCLRVEVPTYQKVVDAARV